MKKISVRLVAIGIIASFIAACSATGDHAFRVETHLDRNWGRSVETAKFNQTINPEAGKNLAPVEGLDGRPAGYAVDKYENSFKKEVKPESTTTTTLKK